MDSCGNVRSAIEQRSLSAITTENSDVLACGKRAVQLSCHPCVTAEQVEMDDTERELISDAAAAANGAPPLPAEPPPMPPPPAPGGGAMREAEEPEQVRIVRGYQRQDPRAAARAAEAGRMVVSPITGELIRADDVRPSALRPNTQSPPLKSCNDCCLRRIW